MKTNQLHSWSVTVEQAKAIQKNLSAWVITEGSCPAPELIARVEVHPSGEKGTETASVLLYSVSKGKIIERKHAIKNTAFPRVDGMLSFRKAPAAIAAIEKLPHTPDLIICDGRGRTGEDSFGLASHIGLVTNLPTIGIRTPKAREDVTHLSGARGQWLAVGENAWDQSVMLRVLDALDPVIVSPAHKICQRDAIEQLLNFLPADMPSRQYMDMLYPSRSKQQSSIPVLQVIAKQP